MIVVCIVYCSSSALCSKKSDPYVSCTLWTVESCSLDADRRLASCQSQSA